MPLLAEGGGVFSQLVNEVSKLNLLEALGGLQPYIRVLTVVSEVKGLAEALCGSPQWMEPRPPPGYPPQILGVMQAPLLEKGTVLGAFLRMSCLPEVQVDLPSLEMRTLRHPVGESCLSELATRSKADLDTAVEGVRVLMRGMQVPLVSVFKSLVKHCPERLFDWVATALKHNEVRTTTAYAYGYGQLVMRSASNGFLFNLLAVMLKLCKPFLDPNDPKALKIDWSYLASKHRMDVSGETRLVPAADADARAAAPWIDVRNEARIQQFRDRESSNGRDSSTGSTASAASTLNADSPVTDSPKPAASFGTISEFFFLTLRCMHVVGPSRVVKDYHKVNQELHEADEAFRAAADMSEEREVLERKISLLLERRLQYEVIFQDVELLDDLVAMARLAGRSLLNLAKAPATIMPLPSPPEEFKAVPEYCVEAVLDVIRFIAMTHPTVLETTPVPVLHDFLNFFMAFSSSKLHVNNPYLRGKLLEAMSMLIPKGKRHGFELGGGNLVSLFEDHDISRRSLIPTLIQFYVDIEVTGAHNQFYEKFNYRHYMAELLLYVSKIPSYLQAIQLESENREKFVRFVNMMLNDVTYAIDESILNLGEIKKIEAEMAEPGWASRPEDQRKEMERNLSQKGGQARWGMQSGSEILQMVKMLTGLVPDPFMVPELRDRVACMLNYFLVSIAGPKMSNLKVANPEKYSFRPKDLLALVTDIYGNLGRHPEFAPAIVRDGRSYDIRVFNKALDLLRTHYLRDGQALQSFAYLVETLASCAADAAAEDDMLVDVEIPDEFQDPVTCEIMNDPVLLPTSGKILDRASITRHLLSDETDPFSRKRLTADMLVPDDALRARIQAFLAEHRKGKKKPDDGDSMDTH